MADFFNAVFAKNWTFIQQEWDLSEIQVGTFMPYFFDTTYRVSEPTLMNVFAQGGGVIVTRTAYQWLWDAPDPLLQLIQPWQSNARLNFNDTTPEALKARLGPTGVYSGKTDPSKIFWYYMWNGTTEITGYPISYPPGGATEDGQFPPLLGPYDPLLVWNDQYERIISLVPKAETNVKGINTLR